jgi:uncharacterized surface anchored protein
VARTGSQERSKAMRKLMLLLAMLAMVVVVTSVAAPAMAQDPKAEKQAAKAEKQAAKAEKQAAKAQKDGQLPKSGGIPVNTALLGLGACAMLVGGGLLVRRVTR